MDLMELLPNYYRGNVTMEKLQSILAEKIQALANDLNETIDQCFINTATTLLSRYEKIYGLQVDVSKSHEFRRERIRAKIRGVGTVTKEMLKAVARSYSNGEVEVIEDSANYRFIIKFVGTLGIPANMADLILTIEEIKPAHLAYTFEYTYRTYDELSLYTHEQLSVYTHHELREGEM
ncbi:YmfQ family protein [Thermoclostridium stercorarium]|uniref:putative phage tail protein n=1 Tax=Thermoclostridium stercorarium TaxID=1510 RepID=UPI002248FA8F|nr:putative phage tail protein [Thermoclostridium stercorarium]UZQ86041.1 YmfQ family protein [Thermoclostridium stercorarium]